MAARLTALWLCCTALATLTCTNLASASSCSLNAGGPSCSVYNDAGSSIDFDHALTHAGNPVDVLTGNKYQSDTDVRMADSLLIFKRHYNSVNAGYNIGLGYGWRSTFDVSLDLNPSGGLLIIQSDGRILEFTALQSAAESGLMTYTHSNLSRGTITLAGTHAEWSLPDGRVLEFKGKKLTAIRLGRDHYLQLYYSKGQLEFVTDEKGRRLRFSYFEDTTLSRYDQPDLGFHHPGHLKSILLPDGTSIDYRYDRAGNLASVIGEDGYHMDYTYADGLYPGYLETRSLQKVEQGSWRYDSEGRVARWEDTRNQYELSFRYHFLESNSSGSSSENGETNVTDALGTTTTYTWQRNVESGEVILLGAVGPWCIWCPRVSRGGSYIRNEEHGPLSFSLNVNPDSSLLEEQGFDVLEIDPNGYPLEISHLDRSNKTEPSQRTIAQLYDISYDVRGKLRSVAMRKSLEVAMPTFALHFHPQKISSKKPSEGSSVDAISDLDWRTAERNDGGETDLNFGIEDLMYVANMLNRSYSSTTVNINIGARAGPEFQYPSHVNQSVTPPCMHTMDCDALNRALEYFPFADCAYSDTGLCPSAGADWSLVDTNALNLQNLVENGWYRAHVYINNETNKIVIAYRGTDEKLELISGAGIAFGWGSVQAKLAIYLAQAIEIVFPTYEIETTGHSLGGGLATLAAAALSVEGVVFGSIGVDEQTSDKYQVPYETTPLIDHFYVEGDPIGSAIPVSFYGYSGVTGDIHFQNHGNLPLRAETYTLPQSPVSSYSPMEAHYRTGIEYTLRYHHQRLNC